MDEAQGKVFALEKAKGDLQREVKELRDEMKELRDEMKELRDGISRKRMTDGVEEAPTLKRRRVEIQEYDDKTCIVLD
jgi:predicted nuclease with TOPRIM domain